MEQQQERWLTTQDIVEMLSVHPDTVRRWLRSGELKGYDLGGKAGWRVKPSDLEAFIEGKGIAA